MAKVGVSYTNPATVAVGSLGSGPFDAFTKIAVLPGASLPSGTGPYAFVVFGVIGNTGYLGDTDLTAEIMLGSSLGSFLGNRHILRSSDPVHQQPGQQGQGFCIMYQTASWNSAADFEVYARNFRFNANAVAGYVEIDSITILAFDLTALGASNYTWINRNPPTLHQMAYPTEAADQLLLSSTIAAGEWLVFYTARVTPGTDQGVYNIWLEQLPSGTWGSPTLSWGLNHLGTIAHGGGGDTTRANYWLGHCCVLTATGSTTALGLASRNLYGPPFPRSSVTDAALLAVKTSALGGFYQFRSDPEANFYGVVNSPLARNKEIVVAGDAPYNLLSAVIPIAVSDIGRSFMHQMIVNETNIVTNRDIAKTLCPYVHTVDDGVPEWRYGQAEITTVMDLHIRGWRNPVEGETPYLSFSVPSFRSVFQGDQVYGMTSQARAFALLDTPAGSTRMFYRDRQRDFIAGENVAVVRSPTDVVANLGTPPYNEEVLAFAARYWQLAGWSWENAFALTPIPDEVAGAEVVIVPGREGLALGSLTALPINPSLPLAFREVKDRTELRTISGYMIAWPIFTGPRRMLSAEWRGLTSAERDTMLAFRAALGAQVFKWTVPHDLAETAWAFTSPEFEVDDLGAGIFSLRADIVELVFVGP